LRVQRKVETVYRKETNEKKRKRGGTDRTGDSIGRTEERRERYSKKICRSEKEEKRLYWGGECRGSVAKANLGSARKHLHGQKKYMGEYPDPE